MEPDEERKGGRVEGRNGDGNGERELEWERGTEVQEQGTTNNHHQKRELKWERGTEVQEQGTTNKTTTTNTKNTQPPYPVRTCARPV